MLQQGKRFKADFCLSKTSQASFEIILKKLFKTAQKTLYYYLA